MSVKLLAEHHLEFLTLKGGRKGLPHYWKSHVTALNHIARQMTDYTHVQKDGLFSDDLIHAPV